MKGSAELSASNRLKNLHLRQRHLDTKEQALSEKLEQIKAQKFHFQSAQMASKALVNAIECELPFAHCAKQTFIVHSSDKLALKGENGAGKTTLLKLILKQISPVSGELSINTPTFYLDQHFGFLEPQKTALESIVDNCDGVLQEQARTLLAGIGFRRESVHRRVEQLSGGEKMKLSMLIVTHQPNSPLLLLDEPDNHLDLSSKQLLAQALFNYQGAFLLVSHDSHFVEECGLTGELGL
jgi:ATPase subunit of ABC transporter with duplicated ATPase domains